MPEPAGAGIRTAVAASEVPPTARRSAAGSPVEEGAAGPPLDHATTLHRLRGAQARVLAVAGVVAGAAALAMLVLVPRMRSFESPFFVPWELVALTFFVAEMKVIRVHFRRETHAFSMSEVPVVAGLFLLAPVDYVAAFVVGSTAALLVGGTRSPLRLLFNVGQWALVAVVTLAIFQVITDHGAPPSFRDWLAALAATGASSVLSAVLVATVITASGGAPQFNKLPEMIRFASLMAISNTSITLLAITVMWQDPAALALLSLPILALFLVYRAYQEEREKHQRLELLYQSSRIMHHTPELDSAIVAVLEHAREMFRAEVAEILLFPQANASEALRTVCRHDRPSDVMQPIPFDRDDALVRRAAAEARAFFVDEPRGGDGAKAMLSPLAGDSGVFGLMRVANRLSAGTGFDGDDLRLLETLANQAAVALENGQLEQSLAELSRLKEQLRFQAFHDSLTGLPNRPLLIEQVEVRLAAPDPEATILYIDLDDFKFVNDSLGHAAGDQVLVAAGERIRECLSPGDLAARLGGDEFAVLLATGGPHDRAAVVGDRILRTLRAPFVLNGQELTLGGSVGIAVGRTGQTADDLLRDADVAMYAAKAGGKRRVARFDPSMHAALVARHTLSGELARALARDELQVHYQPIVELATGQPIAAEALVRWRHPVRGYLPPDEFISIAEETGSILALGRFVLMEAVARAAHWRRMPGVPADFKVSINVSPLQLLQVEFVAEVTAALAAADLPPEALILEMTETVMLRDTQPTMAKLDELKRLGVGIAIDDFGTGYSSLGYLRRFPVDVLKIARDFVPLPMLARREDDWAVANTIVALGRTMNMRIVAEGIEHPSQLDRLLAMGCEFGQGYLFLRPTDDLAFGRYLAARLSPAGDPTGADVGRGEAGTPLVVEAPAA
jgi:diguanylate cyclase (GGDEF)-like protein